MRPHLDYCLQFWSSQYKKDLTKLERVQGKTTKVMKGLEYLSCKERLIQQGLFTLEKKKFKEGLINALDLKENCAELLDLCDFCNSTSNTSY